MDSTLSSSLVVSTNQNSDAAPTLLSIPPLQSQPPQCNPCLTGPDLPTVASKCCLATELGTISSLSFPFSPSTDSDVQSVLSMGYFYSLG
jgi:hypothetical protein